MADEAFIAALKRQRAHLKSVKADPAKIAENEAMLRQAGVDVEELDKEKAPAELEGRSAGKRQTADAPTAPEEKAKPDTIIHESKPADVQGSGNVDVPKPESKG